MKNIKKIIIPTMVIVVTSCFLISTNDKSSTKNLDGVYTLNQIITTDGEVRNFTDGGELIVKGLETTFNTPTQTLQWEIEENNYEIIEDGFIETNLEINQKYIWKKINS